MVGDATTIKQMSENITELINKEPDFYNVFSAMMISLAFVYESRLQQSDKDWQKFTGLVSDSLDLLHAGAMAGEPESWKLGVAQ